MCEYSGRLIAWLDRELPDEEATNVEWHVRQCAECRKAVSSYEEMSGAFLDCYEAAMLPRSRRNRYVWTGSGLAAVAAIVAIMLLVRPPAQKLSIHTLAPLAPLTPLAPVLVVRAPAPLRHRTVSAPVHRPWVAAEPVFEVALPADALFPPGAVPAGFTFIAEVRP